jgi:hypothetical protein
MIAKVEDDERNEGIYKELFGGHALNFHSCLPRSIIVDLERYCGNSHDTLNNRFVRKESVENLGDKLTSLIPDFVGYKSLLRRAFRGEVDISLDGSSRREITISVDDVGLTLSKSGGNSLIYRIAKNGFSSQGEIVGEHNPMELTEYDPFLPFLLTK